ncbi:MAG: hypothetical protein J6Y02_20270 [Pseudobutyrivibrio sp.]|nr:hypothetical protein [Pseudobutyrivibrio sp.]
MANNQYVNQVGLADGTILIDLTTDTAEQSDVLSGKYFHLKTGQRVQGSCTYDSNTTDADASASEILYGKTAYVNKNKLTGSMPNNGTVTGTITTKAQEYTIPSGYHNGLGKVSISSTEQAKIIASNILEGVTILGVTGTVSPSSSVTSGSVSATPYLTSQTILPTSISKDYISQVDIAAIAIVESDNAAGGKTVTIGTVDPSLS